MNVLAMQHMASMIGGVVLFNGIT